MAPQLPVFVSCGKRASFARACIVQTRRVVELRTSTTGRVLAVVGGRGACALTPAREAEHYLWQSCCWIGPDAKDRRWFVVLSCRAELDELKRLIAQPPRQPPSLTAVTATGRYRTHRWSRWRPWEFERGYLWLCDGRGHRRVGMRLLLPSQLELTRERRKWRLRGSTVSDTLNVVMSAQDSRGLVKALNFEYDATQLDLTVSPAHAVHSFVSIVPAAVAATGQGAAADAREVSAGVQLTPRLYGTPVNIAA